MEKLIVKNFGPIKEAEIDLTKYVVFIGDTSTGKSVLAKLISIFRDFFVLLKNKNNFSGPFDYEKELDLNNHLKNFNIDFSFENSIFEYYNSKLELKIKNSKIEDIKEDYNGLIEFRDIPILTDKFTEEEIIKMLSIIDNKRKSVYFPPERMLTSLIGSSIYGLLANNVALPVCFKNFAAKYEVARKENENISFKDFGFNYSFVNNEELINNSSGQFQLNKASSGIQSLLPLLLVLKYELRLEVFKPELNFLVEEPELNLFPIKQKKLIDHILSNVNNTNHKLIITTHSPYILSSLDTLMLAKNTFNEHPDLKDEIAAIVSESKWIDYDDISVYEVRNNGKVYSIKNEEFRSIDTNAIDGVSDIISEEFDKLTELRYAH
jgi:predicted ATPase